MSRPPGRQGTRAVAVLLPCVLLLGTALRVKGLSRSLWLDEAWVANSVLSPSLGGMFFYPRWLQTCAPLFLLLVRGVVGLLGPSNVGFRALPLLAGLAAGGLMLPVLWRLFPPTLALAAWSFFFTYPSSVQFSQSLKPYAVELAMGTLLFLVLLRYGEAPTRRRFLAVVATVLLMLPLGYGTAFLLPGAALAVLLTPPRGPSRGGARGRALLLVLGGVALLVPLVLLFAKPNMTPDLRSYWAMGVLHPAPAHWGALLLPGLPRSRFVGTGVFVLLLLGLLPRSSGWGGRLAGVAGLNILLVLLAHRLSLYPLSPRTGLVLLPSFVLLLFRGLETLLGRLPGTGTAPALSLGACAAILLLALRAPVGVAEDYEGACAWLREHSMKEDRILVHATAVEGMALYASLGGPPAGKLLPGNVGWPCCTRDPLAGTRRGRAAVERDLESLVPDDFRGRVFLVISERVDNWYYLGEDEGPLYEAALGERGCRGAEGHAFAQVTVRLFQCGAGAPLPGPGGT